MKTTKFFLILLLSGFSFKGYSQDFDAQLEKLAQGLAERIERNGKAKIAVWGFFTENGEKTALGNYITEDFSVYLTNFGEKFEVIDRNHLNVLLKEHKLNAEGYIDENTAKELGKIVAVDAIITGTYTVLNSIIKVRAKALDTETALQFAANMGNLSLNENIASYLGITVGGGNSVNRGFNTPIGSNETVNNPETVDEKCREENFGDLCFLNSLNEKVAIRTTDIQHKTKSIFIDAGESKCLYNLKSGLVSYDIVKWSVFHKELDGKIGKIGFGSYNTKFSFDKGELKVETCKSKTYTIK